MESWHKEIVRCLGPSSGENLEIQTAQAVKEKYIPSRIYRYRPVSDYSLRELQSDSVWMTAPRNYNDPFDSAASALHDQILSTYLNRDPLGLLERFNAKEHLTDSEIEDVKASREPLKTLALHILRKDPNIGERADEAVQVINDVGVEYFAGMSQEITEALQRGMRICCFSQVFDSILMWSHYTNQHRGICIEYTLEGLAPKDLRRLTLWPVIYTDQLFDATPYFREAVRGGSFNNLFGILACIHKAAEWQYEREWRLVLPLGDDGTNGFEFTMPAPTKVLLGARISDVDREKVEKVVKPRGIPVAQMRLSPGQFRLDPESD